MEENFDDIVKVSVFFASDEKLFKKLLEDVKKNETKFSEDSTFDVRMAVTIIRILREHYKI